MIRKSIKKQNKNLMILLAGAIVLIIAFMVIQRQRESVVRNDELTQASDLTPTGQEYPVDDENDGVYINYEYGFKFEYPDETFVYYSPRTRGNDVIGAVFRDNQEGAPGMLNLSVSISGQGYDLEYFEKSKNFPVNYTESDPNYTPYHQSTKVRNFIIDGIEGFIMYDKYQSGEIESYNVHLISFLRKNSVITISIGSPVGRGNTDPDREMRLGMLNSIQRSLVFFDPSI